MISCIVPLRQFKFVNLKSCPTIGKSKRQLRVSHITKAVSDDSYDNIDDVLIEEDYQNYQVFQLKYGTTLYTVSTDDVEDAKTVTNGLNSCSKEDYFESQGIDCERAEKYLDTVKHLNKCMEKTTHLEGMLGFLRNWTFGLILAGFAFMSFLNGSSR